MSNMDAHAILSAAAAVIEDARACVAGQRGYEEYMELAQRHREAVNRLHSAQNLIAQHEITIANQAQEIERLRAEVGPEEVSVKPGSVLRHMALRLGLHDYTGFQEPSEQVMRESYGGTCDD